MTDVVMHAPVDRSDVTMVGQHSDPFAVLVMCVVKSAPTFGADSVGEAIAGPVYLSSRAGLFFGGSWGEVAALVESEASTSSQGSLTGSIDRDPHPKPVAASRVRQLKEDSGLTWDQLRRLFGVSRRAVHMWAGGGRMNAQNEERLAYLEQIVAALGVTTPAARRSLILRSPRGHGRSIFQGLVSSASRRAGTDINIEALTESTGAGRTVHGDFLFAEVIDDGEQDR